MPQVVVLPVADATNLAEYDEVHSCSSLTACLAKGQEVALPNGSYKLFIHLPKLKLSQDLGTYLSF